MPADRQFLQRVVTEAFPDAAVEHLGTGGFASTFKVSRGADVFAVKALDPAKAGDIRSEREERALLAVSHPNVVRYLSAGEYEVDDQRVRYLVMEFIDGEPLARVAAAESLSFQRVVEIGTDVLAGLRAVWSAGLAHRDLTPNNIMIRADGRAVIVDLGIARHLDLETVTILPTPGTPGWMAPEQVGFEPQHGDWRSDQYVLGLVLFYLVTGTEPFTGSNIEELWQAPAQQDLRAARSVNPEVPDLLGEVIGQMTARQPYQRYLQPDQLAAALDAAAAGLSTTGGGATTQHFFGLIVGQLKSFADQPFLNALASDAVLLDAKNMNQGTACELSDSAAAAGSLRLLDPANYHDRSPHAARAAGYLNLPYGNEPTVLAGFDDDAARLDYARRITDYQLGCNVDVVLAPYFFARPREIQWLRESLQMRRFVQDALDERNVALPVWPVAAVSAEFFQHASHQAALLNALTADVPETLYLLVHSTQAPNHPLRNEQTLAGIRRVIELLRQAGTQTIVGRRFSEGLLFCALGAAGWSTGISGTYHDLPPHLVAPEDGRGGQGNDWFYVARLLNSLTLQRRAVLQPAHAPLLAPTTSPGQAVFNADARRVTLDTGARYDLNRHNMLAMREQLSALTAVPPSQRITTMRQWVRQAQTEYDTLSGPWHAGENPAFLAEWLKVL